MQKRFVCAATAAALLMTPAYGQRQPDGKGNLVRDPLPQFQHQPDAAVDAAPNGYLVPQNGINYHGGPIMTGTKNVYLIWYGNWSGNTATSIIPTLITKLSGSPYFNINTTYVSNTPGQKVDNSIFLAGQTTDSYSRGSALADADIQTIVTTAITAGMAKDTNGVYFVLTSSDVNETSGFCTAYCGWHTNGTISGSDIKYSFVGNPDRCPSACEIQTVSPNGNSGADGMASIVAHELEEAATDPDLNAWWQTSTGMENADKCAWTFGTEHTLPGGAKYNMTMGGVNYLIQQNWVNAKKGTKKGFCAVSH
jgi:Phosphate-induced protein 1 conserved region